jgi:type 1 glutamine amidotransferase
MRHAWVQWLIVIVILAGSGLNAYAGSGVPANSKAEQIVRVLLTTGGHDFQEDLFFQMFDSLPGVECRPVQLPESAFLLQPGLEKQYDVIVMYDMAGAFSRDEQQAFMRLLNTGIGIVSLHHNLGAHRDWPEFARILGGKYLFQEQVIQEKLSPPSTYAHDQEIVVHVASPGHPVLVGITDFQIHDETYKGTFVSSEVRILLTTDHPQGDPALAWTNQYGKSRIVYLMLGHDAQSWKHPVFPRLLSNAIRWAAGR